MQDDNYETSRMWFDYIGKLSDRSLNRQRASGFTTWAISGVIAVLVSKMMAGLPAITQNTHTAIRYLTAFSCVANTLVFGLALLMILASMDSPSGEIRLESKLDRTSKPLVLVVLCTAFVILGAANLAVAQFGFGGLHRWPFWVLGTILLLNAMSYPVSRLRTFLKHSKHYCDLPELSGLINAHNKMQKLFIAACLFVITLCLAISAVPVIQGVSRINSAAHLDTLRWAFYATCTIGLLVFISIRLACSSYDRFLTVLERRIIVENLSPDAIRSAFVREYLGEDMREWFLCAEKHLKELYDAFECAARTAENGFEEVRKLDQKLKYEIEGRRKAICDSLTTTFLAYAEYANKLSDQVKHLVSQRATVKDTDLLERILDDWSRQLNTIVPRNRSLCMACKKLPGNGMQDQQCASQLQDLVAESQGQAA